MARCVLLTYSLGTHLSGAQLNAKRAVSMVEKHKMRWGTRSESASFVLTAHWALWRL